jgi:asparagine synthase (glutamine-hydrolysing)
LSGIFGFFSRNGKPVDPAILNSLSHSMQDWGRDSLAYWHEGCAGFGQALTAITLEERFNSVPCVDRERSFVFSAAARVDNRLELCRSLNIKSADLPSKSDSELIRQAYIKWGEKAPTKIYGDWVFAAWHPVDRKLFLARDHYGNTALYYYVDQQVCAFASSRKALLDLNLSPIELDELYLAQVLISWPACQGEHTIHVPIRRLSPAHTLTVTPDKCYSNQYWYLEDTPTLNLSKRDDYVHAFREVFDESVHARLRSSGRNDIAISLSGGLDSGAVAAVSAGLLKAENRRLMGFTSIPLCDTRLSDGELIGDEFPLAAATARFTDNIDLYPVDAAGCNPVQAIRNMLQIQQEPAHAAGNHYWLLQLYDEVASRGGKVVLNGQMGNGGVSWIGDIYSQSLHYQLQLLGWRRWLMQQIKRTAPTKLLRAYRRRKWQQLKWCKFSAIHPDFASRLNLLELRLSDMDDLLRMTPKEQMITYFRPGRCNVGAVHAEIAAAYGLEVRDPTADVRVMAFTYSIPDHIFRDPDTMQNRWIIREAMKGYLPDEVRLNSRFGRQAADRVLRLRACATEVEAALTELAQGPAASYVDVANMCQVWEKIQKEFTPETFVQSGTIILRGIMAGLFVNHFFKTGGSSIGK